MTIEIADAIIVNDRNEVFLQHRDNNAPTNPNVWGLWGGHIEDSDKSTTLAAQRELEEELGKRFLRHEFEHFNTYVSDDKHDHVFIVRHHKGTEYEINEGDGAGWFKQEALASLDLCPFTKIVLGDYFR